MNTLKNQNGAALFITLIILLIVVMVGVSAMRGSLFHERMAYNSQAEDLTFQAAETAINSVLLQARKAHESGDASALFSRLVSGQSVPGCVSFKGGFKEADCVDTATTEDTLDSRGMLLAGSVSTFDLDLTAEGFDPGQIRDYQFETEGKGGYLTSMDLPFENTNIQKWRKLGVKDPHFSDHDGRTMGNLAQ